MPHVRIPFIDLAVHPAIRGRFAAGEAVVVVSTDLAEVVWANGVAARLFGHLSIYEFLDDGLSGQPALVRQVQAAAAGLARAPSQGFVMRVSGGFRRVAVQATVERIILPDGGAALLLSSPAFGQPGEAGELARQIISGFDGTDTHVGVLDADCRLLAASASMHLIGLPDNETRRMIADVAGDDSRMVKRMVTTARGPMPAAMGRLADNLHLLFAVEPAIEDSEPDTSLYTVATVPATPSPSGFDAQGPRQALDALALPRPEDDAVPLAVLDARDLVAEMPVADEETAPPVVETETVASEEHPGTMADWVAAWVADEVADADDLTDLTALDGVEPAQPDLPDATEPGADVVDGALSAIDPEPGVAADQPTIEDRASAPPILDALAQEEADEPAPQEDEAATLPRFRFDPQGKAVRFVWKIDREGAFSEASPEFVAAVGPNAADILGRRFTDIAQVFNLDPDNVITDLLRRRDTWSGKTVYWPIQGTDLVVPVDLAALPTYTRDRQFDGFRGFGIVRTAEARPDPEALGRTLEPGYGQPGPAELPVVSVDEPFAGPDQDTDRAPSTPITVLDADTDAAATAIEATAEVGQDAGFISPADAAAAGTILSTETLDLFEPPLIDDTDPGSALTDGDAFDSDPWRGETPALRIVASPGRRESDKVIDLQQRRERARESLSPLEQAAFREIGVRLSDLAKAEASPDRDAAADATTGPERTGADESASAPEPSLDDAPTPAVVASALTDIIQTSETDHESGDFARAFFVDAMAGEVPAATDVELTSDAASDESSAAHDGMATLPLDPASAPDAFNSMLMDDPDTAEPADSAVDDGLVAEPGDGEAHINGAGGATPETETDQSLAAEESANAPEASEQTSVPAEETPELAAETQHLRLVDNSAEAPGAAAPGQIFALPARQSMDIGLTERLVDAIPAALLVHTGDGLIHANPDFLAFTGYATLADLAERGGLNHLMERMEADGVMTMVRADGNRIPVSARLRSVNWHETHALMLALAPTTDAGASNRSGPSGASQIPVELQDRSDASQTRIADLEVETRELRSILETATDGVVILASDGTIRSMNASACALFNYDDRETRSQPFAMLFASESQRAVRDYLAGLADHGVSSVLNDGREVIGRESSGGFLPLFMTMGRLTGSNGYCAVLRDITQWKRSEEELRTAKRAAETANSHKSDFLARVSHEIRTPLNAIIGFSEMMAEERYGQIGSPRYLEYAHDIGNSGKHVLDIVNDLLDISKIEAGQVELEFMAVSLNDHLAECVSMLQPMANSQRVIIRTSLSATVPDIVADQRSIKQIALNLLSNAIRYTPSGGQIVVSTSYEPAGTVVLRIRDTGIGMSRKELEQAMKPFGQVGPGPRQRGDGSGLGLPLTKAMVESNRAQFDIVSAPGEGTLVTISFPPQRVLAD